MGGLVRRSERWADDVVASRRPPQPHMGDEPALDWTGPTSSTTSTTTASPHPRRRHLRRSHDHPRPGRKA